MVNAASTVFAIDGLYAGAVNAASTVFAIDGFTVGTVNARSRVFAFDGFIAGILNAVSRSLNPEGARFAEVTNSFAQAVRNLGPTSLGSSKQSSKEVKHG